MIPGYPEYAIRDRSKGPDESRYILTRSLFKMISEALTNEGIATFSWENEDLVDGDLFTAYDLFRTEVSNVIFARKILQTCEDVDMHRLIFLGHDLGSYILCSIAEQGIIGRGNIFLSGIYSNYDNILLYRYNLLNTFIMKHPEGKAIVDASDPIGITYGINLGVILQGLRRGKNTVIIKKTGKELKLSLHAALFTGERTPGKIIRYIRTPTLVMQGTGDCDIPVSEAFSLEQSLKLSGNFVERVIIEGCDHWYHQSSGDQNRTIEERLTGIFRSNPYNSRFCKEIVRFCKERTTMGVSEVKTEEKDRPVQNTPQNGYRDLKDLFMKRRKPSG